MPRVGWKVLPESITLYVGTGGMTGGWRAGFCESYTETSKPLGPIRISLLERDRKA